MSLFAFVLAATLSVAVQHPAMPEGMSHEAHMKQIEKDEMLRTRGGQAMGFDQDVTTHHFHLSPTGGSIEVTVKDRTDAQVLAAVRAHLRSIAGEFAVGQFDKPRQTHGEMPPGVREMRKYRGAISYRYDDVMDGGAVRIEVNDKRALDAVHDFLRYQIREHQTADPLEVR